MMKRYMILLLAVMLLCMAFTACVSGGESTSTTEAGTEAITLPDAQMPSQPDADYQLPPECPGPWETITE